MEDVGNISPPNAQTSPHQPQATDSLALITAHLEALEAQLPAGVAQPELLSVRGEEIGDPVGQSLSVYQACAKQMNACIEERLGRLLG